MRPAATVMTKIALAGIGLPVILVLLCYLSLSSGGADHNRAAVHLAFDGGDIPKGMSSDYLEYIRQMQKSFEELDAVLDHLDEMAEEGKIDRYLVKSVFYALYFGADRVLLSTERYTQFADCFVNYEERTKTVYHEDETTTQETYTVVIPITEKTEIFQKLAQNYGRTATYEQQSNAMNIWYIARYDRQAPMEGDEFSGWGSWNAAGNIQTYDLAMNETAGEIVRLAMSRLGDPYSQELRGSGEYVDCSYLTLWCYRQIQDNESYEIVLHPSKYLKYKIDTNCSPNTVRRIAFALSYYMEYLSQQELELIEVGELGYEEQNRHFVQFLYWLLEGRHLEKHRKQSTGKGTCNAYLKSVFGFFLYMAECGQIKYLKVLSYNQVTVATSVGIKRTIRSQTFRGYFKPKERNVRAAEEVEIIEILQACTNTRDQLLLLMIAETGFRIGEILGVDYTRDIDYQRKTVRVYFRDDNENEARAKNAEHRRARISDETFEFLLSYLNEYRELLQRGTFLFINIEGDRAGKPMMVGSVYDMLKRMEKKTGHKITPHMLRRYFARSRRQENWNLEMISMALGHKHLDTTIKYLGNLDDKLLEASKEFYEKHSELYGIDRLL